MVDQNRCPKHQPPLVCGCPGPQVRDGEGSQGPLLVRGISFPVEGLGQGPGADRALRAGVSKDFLKRKDLFGMAVYAYFSMPLGIFWWLVWMALDFCKKAVVAGAVVAQSTKFL